MTKLLQKRVCLYIFQKSFDTNSTLPVCILIITFLLFIEAF